MKQPPELSKVQEVMQPGILTRDGFLGDDPRPLGEIIDEDTARVHELGLDHKEIAAALRRLMRQGREGFGLEVEVDGKWMVSVDDARGSLPCPWKHSGMYLKTTATVRNIRTGKKLVFTTLHIHFIAAHGFYEGETSPHRLDPRDLKEVLEL